MIWSVWSVRSVNNHCTHNPRVYTRAPFAIHKMSDFSDQWAQCGITDLTDQTDQSAGADDRD